MTDTTLINILSSSISDTNLDVEFKINPGHVVFKGHFPGSPILPGVLEMQIAEMIICKALDLKGRMNSVTNVRFLKPIYPDNSSTYACEVAYTISDSLLQCRVIIKDNANAYMNMVCDYKID